MAVVSQDSTARLGVGPQSRSASVRERLMAPVPAHSLAVFRIGFGALMAWEAWRYFERDSIRTYYIDAKVLFTWWGFDWVKPHEVGSYIHVGLLGLAGIGLALGLFYRLSATVVWLGLVYLFLLDKARYLNHIYLACLIAFLFVIVPAHAKWSIDARRKPWLRSETVPSWSVWLMRFQVGVPYFFAGVAKLNFDWLVRGQPLHEWLLLQTDFPLIGRFFSNEITVRTMAFSSTLLDLSLPFLMLRRRTRVPVYGLALGFHLMNSRLFAIGVFPWMMMVATTVFFDYDWPKRMIATVRSNRQGRALILGAALLGLVIGAWLPRFKLSPPMMLTTAFGLAVFTFHLLPERLRVAVVDASESPSVSDARWIAAPSPWRRFVFSKSLALFLLVWAAVQLLVPLRHFVMPGNVHWTDEGHRFSWHMLLRQKNGFSTFVVTDPVTGRSWTEDPATFLSQRQIEWMSVQSDIVVQFARFLEEQYRAQGYGDVVVRADSQAWLNSRLPQEFMDPSIDLTQVPRPLIPPTHLMLPLEPYE